MTKEEIKAKKPDAFLLGLIAFHDGKKAIPVLDKELMKLLICCQVGEGLPLIKEWAKGWHSANLLVQP